MSLMTKPILTPGIWGLSMQMDSVKHTVDINIVN